MAKAHRPTTDTPDLYILYSEIAKWVRDARAAAPVGVFSRGTTRISGSLSCGAREVRSPCAWRGGAQLSVALGAVLRSTQLCVGWGAVSAELERGQCVHASVLSRAYPVVPGVAGGKWIRGLCQDTYELDVRAQDRGPGPRAATCKVIVRLRDVNDNAPDISITPLAAPGAPAASPFPAAAATLGGAEATSSTGLSDYSVIG